MAEHMTKLIVFVQVTNLFLSILAGAILIGTFSVAVSFAQEWLHVSMIKAGFESSAPDKLFTVNTGERVFFVAVGEANIAGAKLSNVRKVACGSSRREFAQYVHGSHILSNEKLSTTISATSENADKAQAIERVNLNSFIQEHSEGVLRGTRELAFWTDGDIIYCAVGTDITDLLQDKTRQEKLNKR